MLSPREKANDEPENSSAGGGGHDRGRRRARRVDARKLCGAERDAAVRQWRAADRQISAEAADDRPHQPAAAAGNPVRGVQRGRHHAERCVLRALPSRRRAARYRSRQVLGRDQGQGRQAAETVAGRNQKMPAVEIVAVNQCSGNSRGFFDAARRRRSTRQRRDGQRAVEGRSAEGRAGQGRRAGRRQAGRVRRHGRPGQSTGRPILPRRSTSTTRATAR